MVLALLERDQDANFQLPKKIGKPVKKRLCHQLVARVCLVFCLMCEGVMSNFSKFNILRRFAQDRAGNFAVMTAMLLPILLGGVAFAINTGQIMSAKSRLASALDFALVAVAQDLTNGKITQDQAEAYALRFLKANSPNDAFAGQNIRFSSFEIDTSTKTIRAAATTDVDLAFPIFGSDTGAAVGAANAGIGGRAAISFGSDTVEVAMVVDVTRSMRRRGRLSLLKSASHDFIDTILKTGSKSRISFIPFNEAVRLPDYLKKYAFRESVSTPISSEPPAYDGRDYGPNCTTERKGSNSFTDESPLIAMINHDKSAGKSRCPRAALIPLTNDNDKLHSGVDQLYAVFGTSGQIGLQWAWYMLSPKWGDVLETNATAAPYGHQTNKYVIYLTDGELSHSGLVYRKSNSSRSAIEMAYVAQRTLCSKMKEKGITVFAIGIEMTKQRPLAALKECATSDTANVKFYYNVANASELAGVFNQISSSIGKLALTE